MTTRVWDYLPEYEAEREDILDAVETVFRSGQLVLGDERARLRGGVRRLPRRARTASASTTAPTPSSSALQALGVGPGDEVITVSNTAAPTVVAIDAVGATPVFVDVRESDLPHGHRPGRRRPSPPRTKVPAARPPLRPVRRHGAAAASSPRGTAWRSWRTARRRTAPATTASSPAPMGDAAAFSFYPTKVLGAYGDGGAVDHLRRRGRPRRCAGCATTAWRDRTTSCETPGHNSRLDEVQAEILRRKLTRLDDVHRRPPRGRRAATRRASPTPDLVPARDRRRATSTSTTSTWSATRGATRSSRRCRRHDIELNISYPWPVHTMSGFAHLGYAHGLACRSPRRLAERDLLAADVPVAAAGVQDKVIAALRDVL